MSDPSPQPEPTEHRLRSRAEALTARSRQEMARLEAQRPRHASIEIVFRWMLRDKQIAGGVLGGGLAYRLFFWALALSLLLDAGLGFAATSGVALGTGVKESGLGNAVADSVKTAARESKSGRWWLLILGAYFTLWFSFGVLRALRLVHSAAWRIVPPPLRNAPKAVGAVLATPIVLLLLSGTAGWVRTHTQFTIGLVATLAAGVGFAVVALFASMKLPAPDGLPWTAFAPGAVALGLGLEALHIFTVYFLASKLASASELYGSLGLASTALFYLFLIGRGFVWAAELNAVTWEVRHPES